MDGCCVADRRTARPPDRPPLPPRPPRLDLRLGAAGSDDRGGPALPGASWDRLGEPPSRPGLSTRRIRVGGRPGQVRPRSCSGKGVGAPGCAAWGEHADPAARQEPLPLPVAQSAPESEGGGHGLPTGGSTPQGPDPGALPECGGDGAGGLGSGGGKPILLREAGRAAEP